MGFMWDYIIEGCGIFLASIFPLVGLDKPVNMLERLMWQEIKDSLQPITRWKEEVALGQQQLANEDPESYGLQGPECCQYHTNSEGGPSLLTP